MSLFLGSKGNERSYWQCDYIFTDTVKRITEGLWNWYALGWRFFEHGCCLKFTVTKDIV